MRERDGAVSIILAILLLYLLFPVMIAMCAGAPSRFRQTNKMREVFDFFARILYPWRWSNPPWKKRNAKRKRNMKTVTIYTDGACSGNPGPGGWGAILMYGKFKKELSGGEANTTNNRMELTGVITALEALKEPCVVELWSDSKYVIDGLEKGWAKGWKARGWVKGDKKPALNPDLWDRLLTLTEQHTMHYHWVKGHAENPYNNRCDELAVAESKKFK